jgi:hypothetical protein
MRRKCITMLLALVMVVSLFAGVVPTSAAAAGSNYTQVPVVTDDTNADGTAASDAYKKAYPEYMANAAPDVVLPGLTDGENLVPQGIAYWAEKNWLLVSYYVDKYDSANAGAAVIAALDLNTNQTVGVYKFTKADGSAFTAHMGGIAVGTYNLYYTDGHHGIGYIPLTELTAETKTISISVGESVSIASINNGAETSYLSMSNGLLWTGNFYNKDYSKVPGKYLSMMYGYEISGTDSASEFASLKAIAADPTYVVAAPDSVDQIQGVAYRNGQIILSRSYGRKNASYLTIYSCTLDKSSTVDNPTVLSDKIKEVKSLPMSEGITLAGTNMLYNLFESGAAYYREGKDGKAKGSNPTDQVWKVDVRKLLNERAVDPVVTTDEVWYERVTTLADLTDVTGQYLIAYNTKDGAVPTQYAMQAAGLNAAGQRGSTTKDNPSQSDGDSMYMKSAEQSNYVIKTVDGTERYYFENVPDSALWHFELDPEDSNHVVTVVSNDLTYSGNPCFYFGSRLMYMQQFGKYERQNYQRISVTDSGLFQFYYQNLNNGSSYYLWCNDGKYNTQYDTFYAYGNQASQHEGVKEENGTFHCDAKHGQKDSESGNKSTATKNKPNAGDGVADQYSYFTIYKRHEKHTTQTGKSGTNLDKTAKLQDNGTYNIDMSVFTTGTTTTSDSTASEMTYADTDYVFVLDMSKSMRDDGKMDMLKAALDKFVDDLVAAQKASGKSYRVAVVTFSNNNHDVALWNQYKMTGYYVGSNFIGYKDRDKSYGKALMDVSSALKTSVIANLNYNSNTVASTHTELGMELAYGILQNSGADYKNPLSANYRNAAVVVFTDGIPYHADIKPQTVDIANNAISKAKDCKTLGADVYTVGLKVAFETEYDSPYYFTTNKFMSVLSSNYPKATDLTITGAQTSNRYFYSADNQSQLTGIFQKICTTTVAGKTDSATTNVTLNADSVLRDKITDSFDARSAAVEVSFLPATTSDGSNFVFNKALTEAEFEAKTGSNISAELSADGKTVTVTGFDYSKYYIAYSHPGYKMLVSINGVLLNDGVSGEQLATNAENSGIYKTAADTEATNEFEVPTVDVPSVSCTLDFGLDAVANIGNTVVAVSAAPVKQDPNNYVKTYSRQDGGVKVSADGTNAVVSPGTNWSSTQRNYVLAQTADGTLEWVKLTIVPASNILYEEDKLTRGNESGKVAWTTAGTSENLRQTVNNGLRYGYDTVYENKLGTYSNGTAYAATVNKDNKFSQSLSFTFTGTGFDIISDCGNRTGILAAAVKNSAGETIKVYMVDTYFKGDGTIAHGTTLYQTPVVQNLALDYGTYTVTMNAMYLRRSEIEKAEASADLQGAGSSALVSELLAQAGMTDVDPSKVELVYMDDNSILSPKHQPSPDVFDGEEQTAMDWTTYVDGVRVYGALKAEDQGVYLDGEKNVTYYNIINSMIAADQITNETTNGFAYIEGTGDTTFNPATYQQSGPQNEIYLAKNSAITFKVASGSVVQVSARAVTDKAAQINTDKDVTSNTEMYYEVRPNNDGTVVIQNTGEGMLALVNVKIASATAANAAPMVDQDTLEEACQLLAAGTPEPPTPVDPSGPDTPWVNPFTDVSENDWFFDAVKFVNERKLFVGTTETTFAPRMAMTRGMFVTVLGTLAGVDETAAEASTFEDVNPNAYYAPYVAWAQKNGIVVGTSATTFEPNAEITREQMAIIMYNYAKYAGEDVSKTDPAGLAAFADGASVSGWAQTEMAWAVNMQLMVGSDGKLSPQNHASRAEVAEIVKNYVNVLGK